MEEETNGAPHGEAQGPEPLIRGSIEDDGEGLIWVENAGLVLVAPYFPSLFSRLGLLQGDGFTDDEAAWRAAQLLQFLATGSAYAPEYALVFNKVLCGLPLDAPLPHRIEPDDHERDTVEGLLAAVIELWDALGHTSVEGLRESFLQRGGTLRPVDGTWRLRVEERAFDMLLDRVPWSFRTVAHPWMLHVVQVEWR